MENVTEAAAKTAQKFPWGFIMVLMGGLLGSLSSKYFSKDAQQISTLQNQVIDLKNEKFNAEKDCAIEAALWRDKYLKVVEYSVFLQRQQDSTNRAKLQAPNRELIKAINKSSKR